jgi:hypothetical protein
MGVSLTVHLYMGACGDGDSGLSLPYIWALPFDSNYRLPHLKWFRIDVDQMVRRNEIVVYDSRV